MKTKAQAIAERVVWTFIQGFFGAVPITFIIDPHHLDRGTNVLWAALAGGIAAVISLAKNLTSTPAEALPTTVLPLSSSPALPSNVLALRPPPVMPNVTLTGGSGAAQVTPPQPAKATAKKPPARRSAAGK